MKKLLACILSSVLILSVFSGCSTDWFTKEPTVDNQTNSVNDVIEESYQYTTKSGYYFWPCMADNWVERKTLTTTTKDGTFFCMTEDKVLADDFVVTQRMLLRFLKSHGIDTGTLKYYATDYDDSFSENSKDEAYIALSAMRTWKQVMVTLQTLWGDYIDYGYIWALSNAIAGEMGWETDLIPAMEETALDTFFVENPAAVYLLYPSFTTEYASEETVNCCKALANALFAQINWRTALTKSVATQLDKWYSLVSGYASELSISFSRPVIGYAYYSRYVPLRIMTQYAEHFVDATFTNKYEIHGDIFSTDTNIYVTANTLNQEIDDAVAALEIQNKVGVLPIYWISMESAVLHFRNDIKIRFISSTDGLYVRYANLYLFGYFQHMITKTDTNLGGSWQTNALGELLRAKSTFTQSSWAYGFENSTQMAELFYQCTGHYYGEEANDYYESMDVMTYLEDNFGLASSDALAGATSAGWYLVQRYGETETYQMLLGIRDVTAVTGMTWEELAAEWEQYIRDKYAHVDISDWINS